MGRKKQEEKAVGASYDIGNHEIPIQLYRLLAHNTNQKMVNGKDGKRKLNSLEGRGMAVLCFNRYGEVGSPLMTGSHDNCSRKGGSKSQKP